jgi:hypothetical protein
MTGRGAASPRRVNHGPVLGGPVLGGLVLAGLVLGGPKLGGPTQDGPKLGGPTQDGPKLGGRAPGVLGWQSLTILRGVIRLRRSG